MPNRVQLTEIVNAPLTQAGQTPRGNRWRARIIEGDRWGSSGYYSREVLERDGPTTWPEGTQAYIDHPGETERMDRPERSVRDLAGRIASTPVYEGDGLYADMEFYSWVTPVVTELAEDIGLSIRAAGQFEMGEVNGQEGRIVTSLSEGLSVDLVTRAGAGGKLVSLLESAHPVSVTGRAVSRGVAETTANDTRDALQDALRDAHNGEDTYAYVRDFDDATVWFELHSPDENGTFQQGYTLPENGPVTLADDRVEVRIRTEYVPVSTDSTNESTNLPVTPAGSTPTHESPKEDNMPTIEEARLRQLEADAGRVTEAETERDAANQRASTAEARAGAYPIATAIAAESTTLGPKAQARVVTEALRQVPMTEAGQLDEDALRTAVETARTDAESELAEAMEATGTGRINGFGRTRSAGDNQVSEADLDNVLGITRKGA